MKERAWAKVNLCLYLGPTREDGRHELVTVMEPLELHDTITFEDAETDRDDVRCPGVEGPNLAGKALELFRAATGWDAPPVTIEIEKRIPIAGGMAGGSSDAAATLRLARRASGLGDDALLHDLAAQLGSDVPGLLKPQRVVARGAGERVETMPPAERPYGVLVLPSDHQLSTGAVYAEADRLGLPRDTLDGLDTTKRVNDLERAALSLHPPIAEALEQAISAGAEHAMVSGSGPTVVGFFATPEAAADAAERLDRPAIATRPVS